MRTPNLIADEHFKSLVEIRKFAKMVRARAKAGDKTNITFKNINLKNKDLIYFVKHTRLNYDDFRAKIKITGFDDTSMIWNTIYTTMTHPTVNIARIVMSLLAIVIICSAMFSFYIWNSEKPIDRRKEIEQKIYYLIDMDGNRKYLERYYKSYKENLGWEIYKLSEAVMASCRKYRLPPDLVLGTIHSESGFKKYELNSLGCSGYMQIYVEVHKNLITNSAFIFDPYVNVDYGGNIIRMNLDKNNQDIHNAMIHYNGGRVAAYSGKTEVTTESFKYVGNIMQVMANLSAYKYNLNTNK